MPSEKEIEEAIDWIKNEEFGAIGNSHTYTLIDAYLSMKSERDKYKAKSDTLQNALKLEMANQGQPDLSKENALLKIERDKYKEIVEKDTEALILAKRLSYPHPSRIIDKALSLRDKKE